MDKPLKITCDCGDNGRRYRLIRQVVESKFSMYGV